MSDDLKVEWLEEFTSRLRNLKIVTKRIRLDIIQSVFAEVFAHRPGIIQRPDWQLQALRYAEQKGVIILPKTAWDHTGKTALPKYVERVLEPIPVKDMWWRKFYWQHQLDWVSDLSYLSDEYGEFLKKVNQGIKEGWFNQPAPLKRRSVELTGKEKRLVLCNVSFLNPLFRSAVPAFLVRHQP